VLPAVFSKVWMISKAVASQLAGIRSIVSTMPSMVSKVSSSRPIFKPSSTTRKSSSTRLSVASSKPALMPFSMVSLSSLIRSRVSGPTSTPVAMVSLTASMRSSVSWSSPLVVLIFAFMSTPTLMPAKASLRSSIMPQPDEASRTIKIKVDNIFFMGCSFYIVKSYKLITDAFKMQEWFCKG